MQRTRNGKVAARATRNLLANGGAFTKAIVEGISLGRADLLGDGNVTTSSLDAFLERRVRVLTEGKQTPVMSRPPGEPDFTIALVNWK